MLIMMIVVQASFLFLDYHGQWDKKTGHVAPMYEHPDDDFYFFNAVCPDI